MLSSRGVKPRRSTLPALLLAADIAKLLGWPTWRARRWLVSSGAGSKRCGRWVTTLGKLGEHFPEVLALIAEQA